MNDPIKQTQGTSLDQYSMTAEDVSEKLGYTIGHVRNLALTGELPAIKRNREWRFWEKEVLDFLREKTLKIITNKRLESKQEGGDESGDVDASDLLR